ncbi:MAG TPA: Ig-like domain-containing protein, partial [Kofleriaceae bacterium]|nr:Ig-like domain-containing protein [Kofleriaceae bacterium]
KLSDGEARALLARARPIAAEAADAQAFALRSRSQPPPRTGQTITGAFPPPPSSLLPPAASDAGKDLRVLRWMPEGDVPLAPELSVTFSQPMVAVTSQADAAATTPVKLSPQPAGAWRWIGTRTIVFDPKVRFPQATTYQVEVPAGAKSATGGALKDAVKFKFETPPPTVVSSFPHESRPQHLDAPMFVLFDQKIDPAAVLGKLRVTANGKVWQVTTLGTAELEKLAKSPRDVDKELAALVDGARKNDLDGRWIALRPAQRFPADAQIEVEIPAGTPSAEGPNRTKQAQRFRFRTFPPLRIEKGECGYQDRCAPGQAFVVDFNNPLDADRFDDKVITVSPDVPGLRVVQSGDRIIVSGLTKARTRYKVTVSRDVLDEFGQQLGEDETLRWSVGDAQPSFFGPDGVVVLDPAAKKPTLDFFSTNYDALKVRLYKVEPADFDAYRSYLRNQWNKDRPPRMPGAKVFEELVKTTAGQNELVETSVDLAPALSRAGLGHAIAVVEPHPWKESYEPPRRIVWVQATRLAVDAYIDHESLVAFATELDTGKPAGGVALELRPFGTRAQSDAQGLATLPLSAAGGPGAHFLVARRGDDVAFVADENGYWSESGSWFKQPRPVRLAWYVVDDRKMYKPGEEVSLKGWLRTINPGKLGDVGAIEGVTSVSYTVFDSQNNQIGTGSAPVNAAGGFDTKLTLPKTPNLGYARIDFVAAGKTAWPGDRYSHGIQIEEFRRPEFAVSAQASQGPFVVGGGGDVTVSAKYYAGGPLPGAPVSWQVTASQTSFTPPNRDDYIFGAWEPWWGYHAFGGDESFPAYKPPRTWSLASKTDATGAHVMHLDFLSVKPALPMSVTASASVTDVNRQTWSASSALLVHPSERYVGLKTKKPFVEKG